MKVAVINYCGTVGKTTIAAHLLAPRMEQARIYAIETINETAGDLCVFRSFVTGQSSST